MLEVGQVIGPYRVVAHLGGGGCATVWRARHIHLESDHALKVLREELVNRSDLRWRFLDEGRVQAQLRHPGIVRVTDIVVEPGLAGLVMDFIEGPSLTQLLAERGGQGLARREVLAIASGLFDALHFAHENGVVHRDIKPANLVLTEDHRGRLQPVLLDFGIARVRGALRSERGGDTQMQLKMGTPGYMSPEQLRCSTSVDRRADVFSCGVLLAEMLTGMAPFGRSTDADSLAAVLNGDWRLPEGFAQEHAGLTRIIAQALASEPADRFADLVEFGQALERELNDDPNTLPAGRESGVQGLSDQAVMSVEESQSDAVSGASPSLRPGGSLGVALAKLAAANPRDALPLQVTPDLDESKLSGAGAAYGEEAFGSVYVQWDASQFGGAKEGFMVCERGLVCREPFGQPRAFAFSDHPSLERRGTRFRLEGRCSRSSKSELYVIDLESPSILIRLMEVLRLLQATF